MKIFQILVFTIALALLCGPAAAHMSKVGFINPQRIIMESRIGQIAQQDLSRMGEAKDKRIQEAREAVEEIQAKLAAGLLTAQEEASLEKSRRLAIREYERLVQNSSEDLRGEERRLVKFIMERADLILKRLAAEMGFTMILTDPEAIGYVDHSMDITDRVIQELDKMM